MSGFQRMIAIPQEEYIQLKSMQHVNQPEAQKISELTQQYQQQEQVKDPYEKMILQGSTLEEMKDWKEKFRQDLSLGIPKPYRNRGLSLFRSLEPHVQFNERGEIYGDDKQPIPHSRVEDLIQHAVRDRRRFFTPIAWDYFSKLLKKHNIPRSLLNRATLEELEKPPTTKKRPRPSAIPVADKSISPLLKEKRKRRQSSRYPATDFLLSY